METSIMELLAGGSNAATIIIAAALIDLRNRLTKTEERVMFIITELAKARDK